MQKGVKFVIMLLAVMLPSLVLPITTPVEASPISSDSEIKMATKILTIVDGAKRRVEILINLTLTNETIIAKIGEAGLRGELDGNVTLFHGGVSLLNEAYSLFDEGNYTGAIEKAIEAVKIFREVYRNINRILCEAGVKKIEVVDGQGLLEAMNRALMRIERIEYSLDTLENRTGIDVSDIRSILSEARSLLNITRAMELLGEGKVSEVAHMLAEANKKISEALRAIKDKVKEAAAARIERFKEKVKELCERVRERLKEMNIAERDFFKRWNASDTEDFLRKQIEILNRVRERVRERGEFNATGLNVVGRRMHEVSLELEFMLREREGSTKIEVNIEKTIRAAARNMVRATLRITIKNNGNVTVTFLNSAFGITIEREVNGRWILYSSPISLQVLRDLKPGESGEVMINLSAPPGKYRIVVQALARGAPQTVGIEEFSLP